MNKIKKAYNCLVFLIVTVGGIGKIKYAPGTFGSLAAVPFGYIYLTMMLNHIADSIANYPTHIDLITNFLATSLLLIILPLFLLTTKFCRSYLKTTNDNDPKEVVIDEFVAQLLTYMLCGITLPFAIDNLFPKMTLIYALYLFAPFILFRVFDIIKPWPIGWVDKNIKGALGVMLDDIAAAILASILHLALILIIFNQLVK
ncbi:MAG: Phosphatidylglycerophosphatase [Rickettsiaceae bacterium]|jgi:phosphatidylglycerophosphatase A|nr:Phosphatidylglycerophosphatase [Rickettsiaceae bacterium]